MAVKAEGFVPHAPLKSEQRDASDPGEHVWLSASAGTGKTYVLSARVLRLLLRGVRPDSILCLTFTKAGAAEMAERVHQRLAWWVRLDDTRLFTELESIGEDAGPAARAFARTLFATVLDSRGGGLRIMTIHAFCQTLLAGFPMEAGLSPGFQPIEGRDEAALRQSVLRDLVVTAERNGEIGLLSGLRALSLRLGEDAAQGFLQRAARAGKALDELPDGPDAIDALVRRAMDVPADYDASTLVDACRDGAFDRDALLELARANAEWGTKTGEAAANTVADWLLGSPEQRAGELAGLGALWRTLSGEFRKTAPKAPGYDALIARLDGWWHDLTSRAARAALASDVAAALNAGRRYARAYASAKQVRGLVDFDDLIRLTSALLQEPGIGEWIRYKLDQATDHILVDEAQDTNSQQWQIVAGLAAEFFAGDGARDATQRTIFTVGDFKQAIFGFQGTDPIHYRAAHQVFDARARDAERAMAHLSLNASFRSSQPILDVVDTVLESLGSAALGLDSVTPDHRSAAGGFGQVTLLQPLVGESGVSDEGEEGWIEDHVRMLAGAIARQVKAWLAEPVWLAGKSRALRPADVMILVRKRGDLAALLVARLQAEGVPVAGVDRLRLQAPLAVKDLLAAMRFAIQRADDLTLASLLVSPLMGWDQDALFAVAYNRKGALWDAIPPGATRDALLAILNSADRVTPFQFLEELLSGPLRGRKKLLARLGAEARDPIDELLNAALDFSRTSTASLQGFLDWFDRGDGEIVRDAMGAGDAVRVMTVHGAKGLQAPLVILADAAGDPDASGARGFDWVLDGIDVPLFRPRSAERALVASLADAANDADDRDRREHWRLLYVAMTRAEERLVVAGSLGTRAKGEVPRASWHAEIGRALTALGAEAVADSEWGSRVEYRNADVPYAIATSAKGASPRQTSVPNAAFDLPTWMSAPAPAEARPPRPLAPSSLGNDGVANPPASAAMADAAERGRRMHGLFERLPSIAPDLRRAAGLRWLGAAADADALVDAALRVLNNPDYAALFATTALAEAPIAGVIDGIVVAGTVDRLVVTDSIVTIIDYKTGRRVPKHLDDIPVYHLRQMAAYAAVVAQIFPDRTVTAALLYSAGPVLHRLPPAVLAQHKPSLAMTQDNLGIAS